MDDLYQVGDAKGVQRRREAFRVHLSSTVLGHQTLHRLESAVPTHLE